MCETIHHDATAANSSGVPGTSLEANNEVGRDCWIPEYASRNVRFEPFDFWPVFARSDEATDILVFLLTEYEYQ